MNALSAFCPAAARFLQERGAPLDGFDAPILQGFPPDDFEPSYLAWELVRGVDGLDVTEQRALSALGAACIASILSGSTRLPLVGVPFAAALSALGATDVLSTAVRLVERARASRADDPVCVIIGRPGDRKPLIVEGEWLYTEKMRTLEDQFCTRIRGRVARLSDPKEQRAAARAIAAVASGPTPLTGEQKRAVRDGLRGTLTLVTGGPGTGKTTAVVALVRSLAWMGVPMDSIAIAAPTGKAAQRLSDALALGLAESHRDVSDLTLRAPSPKPLTLHRLLGWSPSRGRFARHENDRLSFRVVVVDEASMIDLAMMDRLIRALRDDARLVLLGDADQLPSVEAGAVFRDLCAALGSSRLTANLRVARDESARGIIAAAAGVNRGLLAASVVPRRSASAITFEGVELLDARWSDVAEEVLERWWRVHVAPDQEFERLAARTYRLRDGAFDDDDGDALLALFAHHSRCRLFCATRTQGFPASADAINRSLLARLHGATLRPTGPRPFASQRPHDLTPGAPVMVQRNDYARGLFNGDQGVVVRVDTGDAAFARRMVVFVRSGQLDTLPLDAVPDLTPAFAMTVHKAQGSEFDHVAIVLPDDDFPILTRELVYTALTRARRSVLLVGDESLLRRAVARTTLRFSGVADRLGSLPGSPPV